MTAQTIGFVVLGWLVISIVVSLPLGKFIAAGTR